MRHIFVVDDERDIRVLINKYLEKEGYKVTCFEDGNHVLQEVKRLCPDLLVLDITMPGMDGIELCKAIRKAYEIPIIFVSARSEELDRIIGLEVGGDDYLTKPFSPRELVIRIKNIFRRIDMATGRGMKEQQLEMQGLILDMGARHALYGNEVINLTGKELDTLYYMLSNRNIALSRSQILEKVWGYDQETEGRIVDDVIKRIRKKLKDAHAKVRISTVWGFGYKIEEE